MTPENVIDILQDMSELKLGRQEEPILRAPQTRPERSLHALYMPDSPIDPTENLKAKEKGQFLELSIIDRSKGVFLLGQKKLYLPGQQGIVMVTLHDQRRDAETEDENRVTPEDLFTILRTLKPSTKTRPSQIISTIRSAIGENAETATVIKEEKEGHGNKVQAYWLGVPVNGEKPKTESTTDKKPRTNEVDQANITAVRLLLAFEDIQPQEIITALGKRNGRTLDRPQALMVLRNFLGVLKKESTNHTQHFEHMSIANRIRQCTGEETVEDAISALETRIATLLKK